MSKGPRIEVFRGSVHNGMALGRTAYFFRVVGRNGEIVAQSESYTRKAASAKRAGDRLLALCADLYIEHLRGKGPTPKGIAALLDELRIEVDLDQRKTEMGRKVGPQPRGYIQAIKEVRAHWNVGLLEAKTAVDEYMAARAS